MSLIEKTLKKSVGISFNNIDNKVQETFSSRPANKINIPEIKKLKCTFVYNYFTKDERIRPDSIDPKQKIFQLNSLVLERD